MVNVPLREVSEDADRADEDDAAERMMCEEREDWSEAISLKYVSC